MPKSYVVLDSGILLATAQTEPYTGHARALVKQFIKQDVQIAAPTLLRYELVAVTRKWVYRELATPDEAKKALDTLLNYPVELHFDDDLLKRGYELATEYNRPTAYDSQYLALAERLSCNFWTADERMFNVVRDRFPGIPGWVTGVFDEPGHHARLISHHDHQEYSTFCA